MRKAIQHDRLWYRSRKKVCAAIRAMSLVTTRLSQIRELARIFPTMLELRTIASVNSSRSPRLWVNSISFAFPSLHFQLEKNLFLTHTHAHFLTCAKLRVCMRLGLRIAHPSLAIFIAFETAYEPHKLPRKYENSKKNTEIEPEHHVLRYVYSRKDERIYLVYTLSCNI